MDGHDEGDGWGWEKVGLVGRYTDEEEKPLGLTLRGLVVAKRERSLD